MTQKTGGWLAIIVLAWQGLCCFSVADAARPNILWISLEDISPDLGCYGDQYSLTPNMDRLASQGTRYTRAFTHAGVCAPSRSGIITGMYPTTMGTHHMRCKGVPPSYVKCFTEYLRAAGYYCTNDNKTDYNFDAPVTAWDDNRPGAHWRNRPEKNQPFFSVINLTTTHESQIRLPAAQLEKRRAALSESERHDPAKAVLPPYYPDTPVTRRDWANYYDNLTFADKTVGKILDELAADGLEQNTIVFCWGDHGRGLPRGKRWIYDSGIRVPLIVRWPGQIAPGTVRDELVCFIDLAPTVLALAGVERPQHLQGQPFLGAANVTPREYIFAARDRMDEAYDMIRAVRDKKYKYIRNYMPEKPYSQDINYMNEMPTMKEWRRLNAEGKLVGPQTIFFQPTKPIEELYDTDADPHEIRNLAQDPAHQETLARLRTVHEQWQRDTNDLGLVPEAELNQRVRPNGKWSVTAEPQIVVAAGRATIKCETEGASIAYQIVDGKPKKKADKPDAAWLLYSQPIAIATGQTIRAKAIRLGYKESDIATAQAN